MEVDAVQSNVDAYLKIRTFPKKDVLFAGSLRYRTDNERSEVRVFSEGRVGTVFSNAPARVVPYIVLSRNELLSELPSSDKIKIVVETFDGDQEIATCNASEFLPLGTWSGASKASQ